MQLGFTWFFQKEKSHFEDFFHEGTIHGDGVRKDLPREALSLGTSGIEVIPHIQIGAGGVADAISTAIDHVEGAFLVLLGDMLIMQDHFSPNDSGLENASEASKRLVEVFEETGLPCVGLCPVAVEEACNYGIADISEGLVMSIIEKPEIFEAPSNLALCGRYIFPAETVTILESLPLSEFGEMQSIFLLRYLIDNGGLNAVNLEGMQMYDSGEPMAWLKSQIDHGLRRVDISSDLLEWLENRISRI